MELKITTFFKNACPRDYSASVAELGQSAGRITWLNAKNDSDEYNLLDTEAKREAFRDHIKEFGAWDAAEIAAMDDTALNALLIQMISGDIRESCLEDCPDCWQEYEEEENAGRLFQGVDGEIYYYIGT